MFIDNTKKHFLTGNINIKFLLILLTIGLMLINCTGIEKPKDNKIRIAMVVKNIGNSFFEACRDGGREAAKELGNIELIYMGPYEPTAEGQIKIIEYLIEQRVHAIAISANDVDELVPICRKARGRGIVVISYDSPILDEEREVLFLSVSNSKLIGKFFTQLIAEEINYSGEIAYLSASSPACCQNPWLHWFKQELSDPKYNQIELMDVVYGDDIYKKSYNETISLINSYPNLKGIVAPTTVGIHAAAQALEDANMSGKIALTGFGLPSEMKEYIKRGTCNKMALWNPYDIGYTVVYIVYKLVKKEIKGFKDEVFKAGRMGEMKIEEESIVYMAPPFVFDINNIDKFAEIY